jgi:putative FmdB family regulatory protein
MERPAREATIMPIYEYTCPHCGYRFEKLNPLSKAGLPEDCPKCGKEADYQMSITAKPQVK